MKTSIMNRIMIIIKIIIMISNSGESHEAIILSITIRIMIIMIRISSLPNSGESHESPPEGVQERPGAGRVVLFIIISK